VAREGVGEEETRRPFIRAARGDGEVTTGGGIRCATAPRPTHVRPAPRTDRGSAARTARVRRRGVATRGVLGRGARRGVWTSGGARPRAEKSSERRAGTAVEGRPATSERATSQRAGARLDTVLLGLPLKLIFSENLNTTRPNFEYESYRSSYPLSIPKRLYGVFLHRF
jgi:hypothetical protein